MRISDWSSDVCSSDLAIAGGSSHMSPRARPAASGLADFVARRLGIGLLLRLGLLEIQRAEIDRFEQQRLEPAVAHRIGEHAPREREPDTRRFTEQERQDMVLRPVAEMGKGTWRARVGQNVEIPVCAT